MWRNKECTQVNVIERILKTFAIFSTETIGKLTKNYNSFY